MSIKAAVVDLARRQHGLVSREQALRTGMSRGVIDRWTRSGHWEAIGRVYRLPGAPRSWHQQALALCLGSLGGVTSHLTAAWLWGLDGIPREPPKTIDLLVPHDCGFKEPTANVRTTRAWDDDFAFRAAIPTTLLSRTIIDLAGVLTERDLELALDSAMRRFGSKLTKPLNTRVASLGNGWPHLNVLKNLLAERNGAFDSALEVEAKRLIWASELPRPQHNYCVFNGRGFVAKVDFAWPREKLILQSHGLKCHLNGPRFRRDAEQQSELDALGWTVLTTTWSEVKLKPTAFMDRLRRAFERRRAAA